MANHIKMAKKNAIEALWRCGRSLRQIAREVGLDRETVSRHVRLLEARDVESGNAAIGFGALDSSNPAKPLTGSDAPDSANPAKPLAGCLPAQPVGAAGSDDSHSHIETIVPASFRSKCEPFREIIIEKIEQGLSAQRIYQDLSCEPGFTASYTSVQRFVRQLSTTSPLPFRRMECAPGEEAQIDFGRGAPIVDESGRRRFPHIFRIVLSYSRKSYSEAVWRQTTELFIRALENAFWYFGGVPKTLVPDNLKAAVKKPDWYDPEINPKVADFCRYYGTVILPTKSYTPRHKGKIESGVKYVRNNALKGLTFRSLAEQNCHLQDWEGRVADHRIHGTTREQVAKRFERCERAALRPLPQTFFPCFEEGQRSVHRDGHVEIAKSYYSVPPEYLGRQVWGRWDTRVVRIFNDRFKQIAIHIRCEPGRFSTLSAHIASEKISNIERGAEYLLKKIRRIGTHAQAWAQTMLIERGVQGVRVLQGLLSLAEKHPAEAINAACEQALTFGAFHLRQLKGLIKQPAEQEQFEFVQKHPIIREIEEYGRIIEVSFREGISDE